MMRKKISSYPWHFKKSVFQALFDETLVLHYSNKELFFFESYRVNYYFKFK